jgi:hypothetical protein
MTARFVTSAALALALVACGDGGGSPPATGGGGTPTPTPTPTSSPTPTPTPTPTYQTFSQLTGTQTFATTCGGTSGFFGSGPRAVGGARLGEGVTIVSDRSLPSYTISNDGTGFPFFSTAFDQSHRDTGRSGEAYARPAASGSGFTERFSIFAPIENGTELPYVRVAQFSAEAQNERPNLICALGVPTQLTDRPARTVTYNRVFPFGTATVSQNSGATPFENYRITNSVVTLTGNPANGQITFSLDLKGQLVTGGTVSPTVTDLGVFTGTAVFDGTTLGYSDIVTDSTNTVAGTFGGGFFGPQGTTAAVSVGLNTRRADGSDLALGALLILRPQI